MRDNNFLKEKKNTHNHIILSCMLCSHPSSSSFFASRFLECHFFFLRRPLNTFLSLSKWKQVPSASFEITVVQNPLHLNEFTHTHTFTWKWKHQKLQNAFGEETMERHQHEHEYSARRIRKEFVYIFGQHFRNVLKQYKYFCAQTPCTHIHSIFTFTVRTYYLYTWICKQCELWVCGAMNVERAGARIGFLRAECLISTMLVREMHKKKTKTKKKIRILDLSRLIFCAFKRELKIKHKCYTLI